METASFLSNEALEPPSMPRILFFMGFIAIAYVLSKEKK